MTFQPFIHYNLDTERDVLGICVLETGAFPRTFDLVKPEHLYLDDHRTLLALLHEMYTANVPIDANTVVDALMRKKGVKMLCNEEAPYFIARLTREVVQSAHLEYWCHTLQALYLEREVIRLTHGGFAGEGDARSKVAALQMQLSKLNQQAQSEDWADMSELMVRLYQHQEAMKQNGGAGLKIGFSIPDQQNGGLQPGQLVILAARPGVGKSAFAGQMALNTALKGARVGIVSLEMSNVEIAARIAAIDTSTDYGIIYRGLYRDEREAEAVYNRIGSNTVNLPIYVSDKTSVNVLDIRAKAEKLKARHGLDMLIIDYLQLLDGSGGPANRNREQEVAQMSRGLKIMAKEMGVPVVALCQLNRESAKRKGSERFPQLTDLRESGAIEQDADVVMFLHSDWAMGIQYDDDNNSTEGKAHLVGRKWRSGVANWVQELDFNGPQMKFTEAQPKPFQRLTPVASLPTATRYDNEEDPF